MKAFYPGLAVAACLIATPVMAQTSTGAAMGGSTTPNASSTVRNPSGTSELTEADRAYLSQSAQGSMYEQKLSQLAAEKSQNQQIKTYAQMVASDHDKYDQELHRLGQENAVTLPTTVSARDQARLTRLEKLTGAAFDRAYVADVRRVNSQDKTEAQKEANGTRSAAIKQFMLQFKQTDEKHYLDALKLPAHG